MSSSVWPRGLPVQPHVILDQPVHEPEVALVDERLELDHLEVAARAERLRRIEHERGAAAHAGREVAADRPEHDDDAAGHVLAAVIADALDDRARAASCAPRSARRASPFANSSPAVAP